MGWRTGLSCSKSLALAVFCVGLSLQSAVEHDSWSSVLSLLASVMTHLFLGALSVGSLIWCSRIGICMESRRREEHLWP